MSGTIAATDRNGGLVIIAQTRHVDLTNTAPAQQIHTAHSIKED